MSYQAHRHTSPLTIRASRRAFTCTLPLMAAPVIRRAKPMQELPSFPNAHAWVNGKAYTQYSVPVISNHGRRSYAKARALQLLL